MHRNAVGILARFWVLSGADVRRSEGALALARADSFQVPAIVADLGPERPSASEWAHLTKRNF